MQGIITPRLFVEMNFYVCESKLNIACIIYCDFHGREKTDFYAFWVQISRAPPTTFPWEKHLHLHSSNLQTFM
jgi:hypothetical protein